MSGMQTPFVQGFKNETPGIPLYDTLTTAAAAAVGSELLFFSVPRSPTKGLHLTNMEQSGILSGTRSFRVEGIRVRFNADIILADIVAMMHNYVLEFRVADKLYAQAPLWYFPAGGGVNGAVSTTASTTTIYAWSNGEPNPQAGFLFGAGRGVTITPSTAFGVRVISSVGHTATSGAAGIALTVMLEGVNTREVN